MLKIDLEESEKMSIIWIVPKDLYRNIGRDIDQLQGSNGQYKTIKKGSLIRLNQYELLILT